MTSLTALRRVALATFAALTLSAATARAADLDCGDGPLIVFAAASGWPVEICRMNSGMSMSVGQAVMQGAS